MSINVDRVWLMVKDITLFTVGVGGISYQQVTGDVNFILLAIFITMTGVPGLTNLLSLIRGTPIESSSPPPVSPPVPSDSSNLPEN